MTARPADNPFASRRIDRLRYRFRTADVETVARALKKNSGRGAIIGPHGSGKTTLLEELADRLDGIPIWIRLNSAQQQPSGAAEESLSGTIDRRYVVLVDGAEQLGPWAWWRLRRRVDRAGTLVITSHTGGRLPMIQECTTDPGLLVELVEELEPETVQLVDLEDLFRRHHGNIRLCFRELYDLWARREGG